MPTCRCTSDDAEAAFAACRGTHLRSLDDDYHHGVDLTACAHCGQRFAVRFDERVRFDSEPDDQTWQVVAVTAEEADTLDAQTARLLAGTRRTLIKHAGSTAFWRQASSSSRTS